MATEVQQQASQDTQSVMPNIHNDVMIHRSIYNFASYPESNLPSQMRENIMGSQNTNIPPPSTHPPLMPQPPPAPSPPNPSSSPIITSLDLQLSSHDAYSHWLSTTPHPPPLAKNARRQCDKEFEPVSPSALGLPININYTIAQLKQLASGHGLHRSGTKAVLRGRLHAAIVRSWHATQIQRTFRGHMVRRLLIAKGLDGPRRPSQCSNDTELNTLDPIDSILFANLVNVPNIGGIATLYDADTLQKHMMSQLQRGCDPRDPYTNIPFTKDVAIRMQEEERLAILLGIRDTKSVINVLRLKESQTYTHRVVSLCSHMDTLGHTTDTDWFLNLDSTQWRKMCSELADIWSYRARLDNRARHRIAGTWPIAIPHADWSHAEIRNSGMDQLERLAYRGVDREAQALGTYYILIALTMVSNNAAGVLSWLYEAGRMT